MRETATEAAIRDRMGGDEHRRLELLHGEFRARYAPEDSRERDIFEMHLSMLIREIYRDAQAPFTQAAAIALAAQAGGAHTLREK